jgi:branched-chain amino acid transport system permease protein
MEYLRRNWILTTFFILALMPLLDFIIPSQFSPTGPFRQIFIFAILGLALQVIAGYTGLLSLGIAGFMALGAYGYSISTCEIYPFQFSFITGIGVSVLLTAAAGFIIGLPTLRLRGDYLAIVTLGFGEIMQDILRNLDVITKGTQGINPLPSPSIFGFTIQNGSLYPWYYLLLISLFILLIIVKNLEDSRLGLSLMAMREDELAARSLGHEPFKIKTISFVLSSCIAGIAGALWAAYLASSGEPGNYDFNISVLALCIVIVGGLGSLPGVLLGSIIMVGLNSIVLTRASEWLGRIGFSGTQTIYASPNNYKYMLFGLALILMMRYRPNGFLGAKK